MEYLCGLNDSEAERILIAEQERRMRLRAPGKYNAILFALRFLPSVRTLYHFGRVVDDIVDGDQPVPQGFEGVSEYLDYLKVLLPNISKVEKSPSIEFLMRRSVLVLEKLAGSKDDVIGLFEMFIDSMKKEHLLRGSAMGFGELEELYDESFSTPQDITLISLGSRIRSQRDIPQLAQIQGRSYAIGDLETDIARGDCRIPKEVLNKAGFGLSELQNNPKLLRESLEINNWIDSEMMACRGLKAMLFANDMDAKAKLLCSFLTWRV